ncbi:DEAD/DEAH box helicase [Streptomyces sp. KS 21]|uniref:DEAD/DEAH box helicase n=1 Tax=Streptomyces sp. KS 21 TaxID=2485150 RepID=UPI00106444E8|nr:DEAD/DEAH box helicase [Streptomyces sp. KS 21]TDU76215.1 helicase-like protein [Streptomyces sp. KS 21]
MRHRAAEAIDAGERLHAAAGALLADHRRAVEAVREAWAPIHAELARLELQRIPVERLAQVTEGRLRVAAIEAAGFDTVQQVLDAGRPRLRQIPGVGQRTADQALGAARQLAEAVGETVAVHLDVDRPEPRTTALVTALQLLVGAGPEARRAVAAARQLDAGLGPLLADAGPAAGRLRMWFAGRERRERALAAVGEIGRLTAEADGNGLPVLLGQASVDLLRGPADEAAAWVDFELRSAEYYGLLAELTELTERAGSGPDPAAAQGFLPEALAERVRAQDLDDTHRRVSLRGYQSFGARFALAQRRVILGDEMGLGKTIQALAALAHLAAQGQRHFLVVCPAGVLINWTREIEARSTLRAVALHGPGRHDAFADWRGEGGVAVTTFQALTGFPEPAAEELGMLVVDEAHHVKNPRAQRSAAVAAWAARCTYVLFLTGTPMENRVSEFRSLVRLLQPEAVSGIGDVDTVAGSRAFRKAVAPAYLRRNQRDVLAELPELQWTDEWEELSAADRAAYSAAVRAGNFMAMRRAAYAEPEKSAKLQRLRELVADAAANGLKVVVFSSFREVLGAVEDALGRPSHAGGGRLFGPISASVPPARRQRLVDGFGAAAGHAVLLAQIEAGGIGINLQAASVVILCEPQVKPTMEQQAVARAHRMGQVRAVRVHRLLATDGVDQRMLEVLERKARLFDAYARRSVVAESAPEAVDVSDTSLARRIVEEEQARLGAVG